MPMLRYFSSGIVRVPTVSTFDDIVTTADFLAKRGFRPIDPSLVGKNAEAGERSSNATPAWVGMVQVPEKLSGTTQTKTTD